MLVANLVRRPRINSSAEVRPLWSKDPFRAADNGAVDIVLTEVDEDALHVFGLGTEGLGPLHAKSSGAAAARYTSLGCVSLIRAIHSIGVGRSAQQTVDLAVSVGH